MLVDPTRIHADRVFEVRGSRDQRGVLLPSWNRTSLEARGVPSDYQCASTVGKLVCRLRGGILDVVARPEIPPMVSEKDSEAPTLAQWRDEPPSQHCRHI